MARQRAVGSVGMRFHILLITLVLAAQVQARTVTLDGNKCSTPLGAACKLDSMLSLIGGALTKADDVILTGSTNAIYNIASPLVCRTFNIASGKVNLNAALNLAGDLSIAKGATLIVNSAINGATNVKIDGNLIIKTGSSSCNKITCSGGLQVEGGELLVNGLVATATSLPVILGGVLKHVGSCAYESTPIIKGTGQFLCDTNAIVNLNKGITCSDKSLLTLNAGAKCNINADSILQNAVLLNGDASLIINKGNCDLNAGIDGSEKSILAVLDGKVNLNGPSTCNLVRLDGAGSININHDLLATDIQAKANAAVNLVNAGSLKISGKANVQAPINLAGTSQFVLGTASTADLLGGLKCSGNSIVKVLDNAKVNFAKDCNFATPLIIGTKSTVNLGSGTSTCNKGVQAAADAIVTLGNKAICHLNADANLGHINLNTDAILNINGGNTVVAGAYKCANTATTNINKAIFNLKNACKIDSKLNVGAGGKCIFNGLTDLTGGVKADVSAGLDIFNTCNIGTGSDIKAITNVNAGGILNFLGDKAVHGCNTLNVNANGIVNFGGDKAVHTCTNLATDIKSAINLNNACNLKIVGNADIKGIANVNANTILDLIGDKSTHSCNTLKVIDTGIVNFGGDKAVHTCTNLATDIKSAINLNNACNLKIVGDADIKGIANVNANAILNFLGDKATHSCNTIKVIDTGIVNFGGDKTTHTCNNIATDIKSAINLNNACNLKIVGNADIKGIANVNANAILDLIGDKSTHTCNTIKVVDTGIVNFGGDKAVHTCTNLATDIKSAINLNNACNLKIVGDADIKGIANVNANAILNFLGDKASHTCNTIKVVDTGIVNFGGDKSTHTCTNLATDIKSAINLNNACNLKVIGNADIKGIANVNANAILDLTGDKSTHSCNTIKVIDTGIVNFGGDKAVHTLTNLATDIKSAINLNNACNVKIVGNADIKGLAKVNANAILNFLGDKSTHSCNTIKVIDTGIVNFGGDKAVHTCTNLATDIKSAINLNNACNLKIVGDADIKGIANVNANAVLNFLGDKATHSCNTLKVIDTGIVNFGGDKSTHTCNNLSTDIKAAINLNNACNLKVIGNADIKGIANVNANAILDLIGDKSTHTCNTIKVIDTGIVNFGGDKAVHTLTNLAADVKSAINLNNACNVKVIGNADIKGIANVNANAILNFLGDKATHSCNTIKVVDTGIVNFGGDKSTHTCTNLAADVKSAINLNNACNLKIVGNADIKGIANVNANAVLNFLGDKSTHSCNTIKVIDTGIVNFGGDKAVHTCTNLATDIKSAINLNNACNLKIVGDADIKGIANVNANAILNFLGDKATHSCNTIKVVDTGIVNFGGDKSTHTCTNLAADVKSAINLNNACNLKIIGNADIKGIANVNANAILDFSGDKATHSCNTLKVIDTGIVNFNGANAVHTCANLATDVKSAINLNNACNLKLTGNADIKGIAKLCDGSNLHLDGTASLLNGIQTTGTAKCNVNVGAKAIVNLGNAATNINGNVFVDVGGNLNLNGKSSIFSLDNCGKTVITKPITILNDHFSQTNANGIIDMAAGGSIAAKVVDMANGQINGVGALICNTCNIGNRVNANLNVQGNVNLAPTTVIVAKVDAATNTIVPCIVASGKAVLNGAVDLVSDAKALASIAAGHVIKLVSAADVVGNLSMKTAANAGANVWSLVVPKCKCECYAQRN
eukprot:gene12192-14269_t